MSLAGCCSGPCGYFRDAGLDCQEVGDCPHDAGIDAGPDGGNPDAGGDAGLDGGDGDAG
jgi:hypothetical protein